MAESRHKGAIFQQDLKRCRMRSTPYCTAAIYFFLCIIYAIILCYFSLKHSYAQSYEEIYSDTCKKNQTCQISVNIEEEMKPPVYLYFKIKGFTQNHRDIAESFSPDMDRAYEYDIKDNGTVPSELERCRPRLFLENKVSMSNLIVPCGLLPESLFNDTITVLNSTEFTSKLENITLNIDNQKNYQPMLKNYSNSSKWLESTGIFNSGTRDPHYIVWMRKSAFTPFRKLYAISENAIPSGNLTIDIVNRYLINDPHVQKSIILTEQTYFGSFKEAPKIVYIFMILMFGAAALVLLWIGWVRSSPKSPFHPENIMNSFNDQENQELIENTKTRVSCCCCC